MNILQDMFDLSMKREHKLITVTDSGESFDCFFRKNNDNNNVKDTMSMYYKCDSPVTVGSLLTYAGNHYIVLNKETAENDVYYKSAIIRTNGVITTHNLSVVGLPVYTDDANNANSTGNKNLSIIDGNMELLTADNALSRQLAINDLFNEYGRTWKITNIYFVDGIAHIIVEVNANVEPNYDFSIEIIKNLSALNAVAGDTDSISAKAYINGIENDNANLTFISSNPEVATISSEGEIEYLTDGEVYFTVFWVGQNVSESTETVTVLSEPVGDEVVIYVDRKETICYDFEEILNYYVTVGGVRDDTIPVSWKIENISVSNNYNSYLKKVKVTDLGNHTIELIAETNQMRSKTFDLVAYNDELGIENRQNIKVISLF